MEIGIHRMHNRWPYILKYLWPRPLLIDSTVREQGYQQYKWMWFYFTIKREEKMKVFIAVGYNGILNGLIMGACSTREKAEAFLKKNEYQIEPDPAPKINEVELDA